MFVRQMLAGAVFAAVVIGAVLPGVARAQTPAPTATPRISLNAPDTIGFDFNTRTVTWRDTSSGEEGFQIDASVGEAHGTFSVGPNLSSFQLPPEFVLPPCPTDITQITPQRGVVIRVRAFAAGGAVVSEQGTLGIAVDCPLPVITLTPTTVTSSVPTPTSAAAARLPSTGYGAGGGGDVDPTETALFLAAFVIAAMVGVVSWRAIGRQTGDDA